ncbi:MAG: helix-turn-helix transcriptional regulator [Gemmatimonadetes bacterium]|nr:helix-turn-helix transcriptional regulator [Gemmatimonadota bacterium]
MLDPPNPAPQLPLKPDLFQILLALEDGERHGYGIIKEVERSTDGQIRLEPSPLYRRLKRLLDSGIVQEADKRPVPELDDERRRYYRLTDHGRSLITAEAQRLVALAGSARVKNLARAAPRPTSA